MRALLFIMLVLLVSCAPAQAMETTETSGLSVKVERETPPGTTEVYHSWNPRMSVVRIIDSDARVVCWLYNGRGISCLPINSTKLY